MFKSLMKVVVVLAILLFGAKFGLEFYYKSKLDDAIQMARPFAKIRYDSLNIGLDGSIKVSKISMRTTTGEMGAEVDRLRLFSSNRLFLVQGPKIFEGGKLPNNFDINIDGWKTFGGGANEDLPVCLQANGKPDKSTSLKAILGNVVGDTDILLDAANKSNAKVSYNTEIPNAFSVNVSMGFDGFVFIDQGAEAWQNIAMKGDLPINNARVDLELDPKFAGKLLSYCADRLNITTDEYLSGVIGANEMAGIEPSVQVKEAFQRFMKGGTEISFLVSPTSKTAKNFRRLSVYQPREIIKLLNLKMELDGQDVPELFLDSDSGEIDADKAKKESAIKKKISERAALLNKKDKKVANEKKRSSSPKSNVLKKKDIYRKVRLSDAKRYIGRKVRLKRRGRLLEGRLISWNDRKVVLERVHFGGRTEMPLNTEEVAGLEILK